MTWPFDPTTMPTDCATCAASSETRLVPCDECGAMDDDDEDQGGADE